MRAARFAAGLDLEVNRLETAKQAINGVAHVDRAVADQQAREAASGRLLHDVGKALLSAFEVENQPVVIRAQGQGLVSAGNIEPSGRDADCGKPGLAFLHPHFRRPVPIVHKIKGGEARAKQVLHHLDLWTNDADRGARLAHQGTRGRKADLEGIDGHARAGLAVGQQNRSKLDHRPDAVLERKVHGTQIEPGTRGKCRLDERSNGVAGKGQPYGRNQQR